MGFPSHLYRLRAGNTEYVSQEIERLIQKREIFVSPLFSQNDIFEGKPAVESASKFEIQKFRNDLKKKLGKYALPSGRRIQDLEGVSSNLLNNSKISKVLEDFWSTKNMRKVQELSFSGTVANNSIACLSAAVPNPKMWAHYGDNGCGVCFELEVQKQEINRSKAGTLLSKVSYTADRPSFKQIDLLRFAAASVMQDPIESNLTPSIFIDSLLLTKSNHWSSEHEWRILNHFDSELTGYVFEDKVKLKSVILGVRANRTLTDACLKAVSGAVPVFQTAPSRTTYGFEYNPV